MDFISFMLVVWVLKILAEDAYHGVKGTPNPRAAARARRQRTRKNSRTWGAVTGYWGDLVEDAGEAATEHRRRRAAERRKKKEAVREEQPSPQTDDIVDAEIVEDEPESTSPPADQEPEIDLPLDEDPAEPQVEEPAPKSNVYQFPTRFFPEETMSANTEVTGLDQSIAYARSIAGEAGLHGTTGNEGYIGHLTQRKVQGQALQSAYDMQAAFAAAAEAAERHAKQLERQKAIQEGYDQNADAGDKQFMQEGR
jgi:hypothetical protein